MTIAGLGVALVGDWAGTTLGYGTDGAGEATMDGTTHGDGTVGATPDIMVMAILIGVTEDTDTDGADIMVMDTIDLIEDITAVEGMPTTEVEEVIPIMLFQEHPFVEDQI